MAHALRQTGNTDDSRKCSHGNVNECALSQAHRNVSIHLLTSIHPWCYSAKSSLSASGQVNVWVAGDLARKMKRDWECFASIVQCFFGVGLIPAFFVLLTGIFESPWNKRKMEVCTFFCFPLSSGNRSSVCLFNLADSQASSTHTSTLMTSPARPFSMIVPCDHTTLKT